MGEGGLEPPNSEEDRFTVCCNCHYATLPLWKRGADRGIRTPDPLITNQLLWPTELHRHTLYQTFKYLSPHFSELRQTRKRNPHHKTSIRFSNAFAKIRQNFIPTKYSYIFFLSFYITCSFLIAKISSYFLIFHFILWKIYIKFRLKQSNPIIFYDE